MADAIVSFGVQKLWELLSREYERLEGVDEKVISELKSDLNMLRSFLKDADAKKHTNAMVRNCVEEIKEIVSDAEDTVETFLLKEETEKQSGILMRIRRLACIVADRREVALDMGGISKRISKVTRDMQSFGVQQMIVDNGYSQLLLHQRQREMRQTFSSVDIESDLVGLKENVDILVGYLLEEDCFQVVSITGMGGIGKTTLARQVYNHDLIIHHFDRLAWVCVSQQFTRKYVWQVMLRKLNPKYDEHVDSDMTEDQLQDKLVRFLETGKYLIFLDDVWTREDWNKIKHVFPPKKEECKVDEKMEDMGMQMVKHCGGLPLAVKVLGGLLATQYTIREWTRTYENIGSHIVRRTDDESSSVYYV
ncbi:unnamed protein product [Brassica oleracea]